jgi:dolichol-phosphate mannosyltransferase
MHTLVIIPTYNECENIERLVAELLALASTLHVLVVDDNSPDGTGQLVDAMAAGHERVHIVHRAGKLGLGTAYIAGFKYAIEHGFELALTMDADFSHQPRYVPDLLAKIGAADLVIGSRYVRGGGAVDSPLPRRLLSWGANLVAKLVLGLQAWDCTAGFRCYRREVLESIDLDAIFAQGYSFLIEMLYLVQRGGWSIAETPIQFLDRRQGTSKVSRAEIYKALYTVVRLGFRRMSNSYSRMRIRSESLR